MKREQKIQQEFIQAITSPKTSTEETPQIDVYRELVYYRFLEVFEKAYPRFVKMITKEQLTTLIYDFLKVGARTPILWKVSGEFQEFVVQNNTLEIPFVADLLAFEFLEVQMYMREYSSLTKREFSLEECYTLSTEIELRHFTYPIHHPDFDANPTAFQAGEFSLLFFYSEENEAILCEEISPFVEEFLLSLDIQTPLLTQVEQVASEYEIQTQELLEILSPLLESFCERGIIL